MSAIRSLFFIIMVILAAGCAGTSRPVIVSASDGLQINDFSADVTDVFSSELVRLNVEVENVGGTTAQNVNAVLFGSIKSWTAVTPSGMQSVAPAMTPPLQGSGSPGDMSKRIWTMTAPYLPQGLSQDYPVGVRVGYDYTTTSITSFDVVSYDQFDLLRKKGEFVQVDTKSKNSNAPVKIELAGSSPMRPRVRCVEASAEDCISETMTLTLANVGSGVPFRKGTDLGNPVSEDIGVVLIGIRTSSGKLECDTGVKPDSASDTVKIVSSGLDAQPDKKDLRLARGFGSVRIPCSFTMKAGEITSGVPKDTVTAEIVADYSYAIDGILNIKVTSNE